MSLAYFKQFAKASKEKVNKSKEVWIYTRVSSKEQFDNNNSVDRQEGEARNFSSKNNFQVSKIFGSTYESAKKDFTRKEFMKMIDEVRKVKIKPYAILIYKMSRFSRSGGGAVGLVSELVENLGVHLIEVCSGIDTTTEAGKLSVYNSLLAANKENLDRKEVTYGGMKDFVKKGNRLGNAPKGFDHYGRRVKNPKFFAHEQKIIVNETGKALRKGWHWKAEERLTDVEISKRLKQQFGVPISPKTLSAIWRNPFYCGINVSRLTDGEPKRGNWEAMISEDTFKKVQEIINENPKQSKHLKYHAERPLTGFLVCSECERKLTGYENKKKKRHYYKCQKCKGVSLNAETTPRTLHKGAHQMFLDYLSRHKTKPELLEPFKIQFKNYCAYLLKDEQEREKGIAKNIKEKETELYTLKKDFALRKFKESEQFYNELKL
ncbi:MAG: recombinase family protein, partial [Bacteroidetes bacterium]|nr:recombinase family protein [Bacteroidota bacterium]